MWVQVGFHISCAIFAVPEIHLGISNSFSCCLTFCALARNSMDF